MWGDNWELKFCFLLSQKVLKKWKKEEEENKKSQKSHKFWPKRQTQLTLSRPTTFHLA